MSIFQQDVIDDLGRIWPADREKRIHLPVGSGITRLSLLAPLHVPRCKVAVRYLQPALRLHYKEAYQQEKARCAHLPSIILGEGGFIVRDVPVLHVWFVGDLGKSLGFEKLAALSPDLVIIDHHDFKYGTVRHERLYRYISTAPVWPRLLVWT